MRYYQVDPKLLKPESTIVYLYAHADVKDKLNEKNFVSYAPDDVGEYSTMPQTTKDYYRETIEKSDGLCYIIEFLIYFTKELWI